MSTELLSKLLKHTNEFISEFRENPYHYLQERDIQCALFAKLRSEINDQVSVTGINKSDYKMNLINSEYLNSIDITCLDPSAINNLTINDELQEHGQDWYIYHLPIILGIEIKYIWMGQTRGVKVFTEDVVKFKDDERAPNWLSICFIQDNIAEEKHLLKLSTAHSYKKVPNIKKLNEQYIVGLEETYLATLNV